jgi:hypothetical protein
MSDIDPTEAAEVLMQLSLHANLLSERIEQMPTVARRLAPIAELRRIAVALQAARAR